jgi:CheY-like chemotaxis protein
MSQPQLQRILLVDDEADLGRIGEVALAKIGGFDVRVASSGTEALEAADFRPDLILLDVMMPGMNGLETLEAMGATSGLRGVPVVFLTARAQQHEIEEYLRAGALDVITKPFDPTSLADEVRDLWKSRASK